ncbi:hypothetical protein SADUNF_Sadunf05G0025500 [Salix dunnii]|uniref:Uncharacterized protein n=1 Tax=Salix dunnii TaxID=1413687 RepID=A0A835MYG9_9ROSI|nr:hypothetical protein SADUNF_Sadunf05G0025500 [Salix dunnii]
MPPPGWGPPPGGPPGGPGICGCFGFLCDVSMFCAAAASLKAAVDQCLEDVADQAVRAVQVVRAAMMVIEKTFARAAMGYPRYITRVLPHFQWEACGLNQGNQLTENLGKGNQLTDNLKCKPVDPVSTRNTILLCHHF